MTETVKQLYHKYYSSIGFERRGLFELIRKEFNPELVLYPGSSVHITPSFYFCHVVYIDRSPLAIGFFSDKKQVSETINSHKISNKSHYWRFLAKDFHGDLELEQNSFDLLVSLFSGKLIESLAKYLKINGLILTNSLFSDNDFVKGNNDYRYLGLISCKNKIYRFEPKQQPVKQYRSTLKMKNKGFDYDDKEFYFMYQKKCIEA